MPLCVTDRVGEAGLLEDPLELLRQPSGESLDDRPAVLLSRGAALVCRSSPDACLDLVEGGVLMPA